MNVRLAKQVLSSVAVLAAVASSIAACDLGLTPYVPPVDAGPITPITTTPPSTGLPEAGPADAGADADAAAPSPKRVFVTSTRTNGMFMGQAAADVICQNLAVARMGAGVRFVAYVSETAKNAIDHITDVAPWFLTDRKTLVFQTKMAITQSGPSHAINLDESGTDLGIEIINPSRVWTGTNTLGLVAGAATSFTCNDWTVPNGGSGGIVGDWSSKNLNDWVQKNNDGCNNTNRFYCFEQ